MQPEAFYQTLVTINDQAPNQRFHALCSLHTTILAEYLAAIRAVTADQADYIVADGRSLSQIVGHIAAWERNTDGTGA